MAEQILIVEDDLTMGETLKYRLDREGYHVTLTSKGRTGVEAVATSPPDLILLDVMLPDIDGFEVCRLIRQTTSAPVLMVTARTDEVDRVVGLEVGADDYITKPFSMRELLARIKAQLRRVRLLQEEVSPDLPRPASGPLHFDDLVIDLNRCEVTYGGKLLQLKPKEYELLAALAQRKGQVLSREQLMRAVWGATGKDSGQSRTVDVHIRWLREKIEETPGEPQRIVTVRGIGYRFDG